VVSAPAYILSAILLAVLALSVGFSAFRIRRHLLPGWDGAPARLVEAVLAVALLIWLCELLGLFGLLYAWTLIAEGLLLAGAVWAWGIGAGPGEGLGGEAGAASGEGQAALPPPPAPPRSMTLVAIAVVFVVFAHWGTYLKPAVDHGMSNFDSLWSFMPFAANMAQTHSVVDVHYTETAFSNLNWLYPQNVELFHATGILLTGRDTLSLFVNFGWLAFAFLAAWCAGRPYGRGPLAVVAAAITLECNTLIVRAPGTAKDDVMAAALLLAAVAILLNARAYRTASHAADGGARYGGAALHPGWPLAMAGLAVGLAVGTKATALAMAAALTVAVIVLVPKTSRRAAAGWWLWPAFAGGGLWYLRDLVLAGNPLPQVEGIGPISLPHPEQVQKAWPDFSVLHYATDTGVWRDYFGPGLEFAFGSLWPLVVLGAVVGGVIVLFERGDPLLRWLGGIALFGLLAYLATPLSAPGPEGEPFEFWINVRYGIPALLLGFVVLPLSRALAPVARQWALMAALLLLLLITNDPEVVLEDPGSTFALLLAVIAVAIPALILSMRRLGGSERELVFGFAVLALLVIAIGYPLQRHYLENRFGPDSGLPGQEVNSAYLWARDTEDARIGLAGTTAGFYQYGFYGTDLSNRAIYIGEEGPHAAFNPIPDCRGFRAAVDRANLDYLVTSPFLNFAYSSEPISSPEAGWLRGSPGVEAIDTEGLVTVWRVVDSLDPSGCGPRNAPLRSIPQQPTT
jgi:hypothetical protein